MKRFLLLFFAFLIYTSTYAQPGAGPVQSCSSTIPEICNGSLYPAAISGIATAPAGTNLSCGFNSVAEFGSFYFFESHTNGPLNIDITPVDVLGGQIFGIDLDFICWGPFNDLLTMCDLLTNPNQEDCSILDAAAAPIENLQINNAVAGEFYVVLIANWADAAGGATPDPCYIQFTSANDSLDLFGGQRQGVAGNHNDNVTFCDSDPPVNLIDMLNATWAFPPDIGSWTLDTQDGTSVPSTFDPAVDPSGTYVYTIGPASSSGVCPADTSYLEVTVYDASSISITSPSIICSNENVFTLTANPPVGWSAQGFGEFTDDNTGQIITDFNPVDSVIGSYNITYTYTPQGCNPIPVAGSILINEAPVVLPSSITINNPSCFGYTDGTAIINPVSGGTPPYIPDWYGQNPLQLPSGTFNYTITDDNQCVFSSSVTLYDPLNTSSVINEYNSSCFGANDGSASITMLGATTPPGTISLLPYCPSNPNPSWAGQPSTSISEVQLLGDNVSINNNTLGSQDFYEDYTASMYADITEGGLYTVSVTPFDESVVTGDYPPEAVNVYIDFIIDGDFGDLGEDLGVINIPNGTWIPGTTYNFNFTVPATGAYGATRMRVVCMGNGGAAAISMGPCESPAGFATPWFGATEDYSVVLNAPASSGTFSWYNGSTADSISNLGPGTYSVIITVAGCPVQDFAVITEPTEIMFNPIITDISCNAFTDGVVTLNPSGGNGGAYNINWGGNDSSALGDGSYLVTVTDPSTITANNPVACENDTTIIMIEPAYFSVDFTTSSNEICLNDPVTLEFNFNQGGVLPATINYTVNGLVQVPIPINSPGLNNIAGSPSLLNNTYVITSITDANGCINQNNIVSQDIYVNELPDINIGLSTPQICLGDDAILTFTGTAGSAPYVVDYTEDGVVNSVNVPSPSGTLPLLVSPSTTTTYELTFVTDSKGCISGLSDNTTLVVNELPQVTLYSLSETCDGDVIQLYFNFSAGVAPWVVNYSVNSVPTVIPINNAIDSIAISPSSQSSYTVNSVTDANGCINPIMQTIIINTNPLPEISLSGGGSICEGDSVNVDFTVTSGTPPYTLNYLAGFTPYILNMGTVHTEWTKEAGIYSIQSLTDNKGCKAISITGNAYVNINPLPNANISAYPQPADIVDPVIHFIDASTGHVNGLWNFDDGTTAISNFNDLVHIYKDTGTYHVSLEIESDSGCIDKAWQTIIISPVFSIYIPSAFTPNNDLNNDYFLPIVDGVEEYEFSMYTRSGQRFFTTNEYRNDYLKCLLDNDWEAAWDGKINNEYATKGVYTYSIILTDLNGKLKTYEGAITLIR